MREKRGRDCRRLVKPLLLAVLVQAGMMLLAGMVVVWVVQEQEDSADEVFPVLQVELPTEPPVQSVIMEDWQQTASLAPMMERFQMDAIMSMDMPVLPQLPEIDRSRFPELPSAGMGTSMTGELQNLLGDGLGMATTSFLGIEETGQRILILFDISQTVVNRSRASGVSMEAIREETIRLIEGLDLHTQFGLIQFSRVYETFQDFLIPATRGNREIAVRWMQEHFAGDAGVIPGNRGVRTYPRGVETVLQVAFAMEPDVVFIVSDGAFWRSQSTRQQERVPYGDLERLVTRLRNQSLRPVRMHFIGFQMQTDARNAIRRIVEASGGSLRELGK